MADDLLFEEPDEDQEETVEEISEEEDTEEAEEEESEPEKITLIHRGREIQVGEDELVALAQKGFDYESKMRDLKETSADYQGYEAMKQIMEQNPEIRDRVRAAFAAQESDSKDEEEQESSSWSLLDDEDEAPVKKTDSKLQKEIQSLREQVESLSHERASERASEQQKEMEAQLRAEVEKYPALVAAGDIAYAPILGLMTLRPEADVSKVVEVVNNQFKEFESRIRGSYTDDKRRQVSQAKPIPKKTSSTVLTPPKFSASDMESGNTRRAALAFLEQSAAEAVD